MKLGSMLALEEVAGILNAVQHRSDIFVRDFVNLLRKSGGEGAKDYHGNRI